MKRLEGRKHLWTYNGETAGFIKNARGIEKVSDGAEFDAIDEDNKWTTYDYAVDIRAVLSEVMQELLK